MSGFSPDWLDLREPADHRARNRDLLGQLAVHFAGGSAIHILDLGCGTGSTLRAIHSRLPERQLWKLVDHDPGLLTVAAKRLQALGFEDIESQPLRRTADGQEIAVRLRQADLTGDLAGLVDAPPDLITASALIDLVSANWINGLVNFAASHGAAIYAALNYNGHEAWSPPHAADADVLAAFLADQRRDKGFGPALGPEGTQTLAKALRDHGYTVEARPSPWRLDEDDRALINELAAGIAGAVSPMIGSDAADAWASAREQAVAVEIGHLDLLAFPNA